MPTVTAWMNSATPQYSRGWYVFLGNAPYSNAAPAASYPVSGDTPVYEMDAILAAASYTVSGTNAADALAATTFTSTEEGDPPADVYYKTSAETVGRSGVGLLNPRSHITVAGGSCVFEYCVLIADFYLDSRPQAMSSVVVPGANTYPAYQYVNDTYTPTVSRSDIIDPRNPGWLAGTPTGRYALGGSFLWQGGSLSTTVAPNAWEQSVRFNVALLPMSSVTIRGYTNPAVFTDNFTTPTWTYSRVGALPQLTAPLTASTLASLPIIGRVPTYTQMHTSADWSAIHTTEDGPAYLGFATSEYGPGGTNHNTNFFIDASDVSSFRAAIVIYPEPMIDTSLIGSGTGLVEATMLNVLPLVEYVPHMQWRGVGDDPALDQNLRNQAVRFSPVG